MHISYLASNIEEIEILTQSKMILKNQINISLTNTISTIFVFNVVIESNEKQESKVTNEN